MSPGASSFPCGLSGGDSGRGSQWGDGGRELGRRSLVPLPPGAGTACVALPARSPRSSRPERPPGAGGGSRHAASGTPASSLEGGCCGLPLHPQPAQDPGTRRSCARDPIVRVLEKGDGARVLPLGFAIPSSCDPWILGAREDRERLGVPSCPSRVRGEDTVLRTPLARIGSRKEGRRPGPPTPLPDPAGGVGWREREREGCWADSPPAASSAAGIFFLIIECEV